MRLLIGVTLSLLLAAPGADAAIFGLFGITRAAKPAQGDRLADASARRCSDRSQGGEAGGTHPKQSLQLVTPDGQPLTATA